MWSLVNELSEPGKYFNTPIIGKCTRMFKSSSAMKVGLSRVCIVFLVFFSSCCYSEIYKWTDANGQVHYSDKKADAGNSKAEAFKVRPLLNVIPPVTRSEPSPVENNPKPFRSEPHKPSGHSKKSELVDYRCTLARNIISGKATLINGLKTGKHEIEVAERDIRKYCN